MNVLEPALVRLILEHSSSRQRVRQLLSASSRFAYGSGEGESVLMVARRLWEYNVFPDHRARIEEILVLLQQAELESINEEQDDDEDEEITEE